MMTLRRSSGCGACIPELTTRRHRRRLLCLGSRAKPSTLQGRHRRFTGGSEVHVSFRELLSLLATQQKWYHHLQQVVQSLIPHNYRQHWSTQQTACRTHTHTRTVTELFTYEVLLYSRLYLFEYCFHLNSGTVHPLSFTETGSARSCHSQRFEKSLLRKVPGNCYNRPPTYSSPSALPTIQQTGWFVQEVSSGVVAFCLPMILTGSRFSLICGGKRRDQLFQTNSFHSCR